MTQESNLDKFDFIESELLKISRSKEASLTSPIIDEWQKIISDRSVLYDFIAEKIALNYNYRLLSFNFSDQSINLIFGLAMRSGIQISDLLWDIFLAFDSGEFSRGDGENDAEEHYTRPAIRGIVEKLKTGDGRGKYI